MPIRCKSIAGQRVTLGPGDPIIPGCELIEGSGIFENKEEFPFMFAVVDGVAGDNGAVVIWPDTGNDLMKYGEGETVPAGTTLHAGCVIENGELKCAPYITENDSVAAEGPPETGGSSDDGDEDGKGVCVGSGQNIMPSKDEKDWLKDLANFQIPDLEAWLLSGFTAKIQEMMGELNKVVGKLNAEVDKIMARAVIDPDSVCKDPLKKAIQGLLKLIRELMKIIPILQKIVQIIKIIKKVIKLVRKILKWTPPFIVPIVEKLMQVLNIMGLVDMCVSTLIKAVGRFNTIIPILFAQLMAILASCRSDEDVMNNKEACEAAGGTWIDPDDLKELQDMYDKMVAGASTLDLGDESIGFCSITEHLDKKSCEDAGGTWTDLDTDTDFDEVDTSALSKELAKQLEELERCFSSPELKEYLSEL